MKISINVRIETTPGDAPGVGWGQYITFQEDVNLNEAGFETVSKVFTRCHDLLETLRSEHEQLKR